MRIVSKDGLYDFIDCDGKSFSEALRVTRISIHADKKINKTTASLNVEVSEIDIKIDEVEIKFDFEESIKTLPIEELKKLREKLDAQIVTR